jgi:glycosyltransferase involved in cell wall biosynthesis
LKEVGKRSLDFDVVHSHFLLPYGFVGAYFKEQMGKPFALTVHGGDAYKLPFQSEYYQSLSRYVLDQADRVISVCDSNIQFLLKLGLDKAKMTSIPNGYDERYFKPMDTHFVREKLGLPLNKKIVLSVGYLNQVKGHVYLIDAIKEVLRTMDIRLVIIGSGPLEMKLREKIRKLNLEQKILLVGYKKHNEIPLWLNASDLFVISSLNEGFPTVIPEALACGKPVVATDVGGIPEAITCDDVGTLVKPQNSKMLASAISEALSKEWDYDFILNYAKRFSWEQIVEQISQVYSSMLHCSS